MPRTIQVVVPPSKTDELVERVRSSKGVVGLALQRGVSLDPPGDIVIIQSTNDSSHGVLSLLDSLNVTSNGSVLTSQPLSLVSPPYQNRLNKESNETIWEEVAFLLRRDTNLGFNYLSLMALAGAIAAAGIWTDMVHIVIGAMVIAPGFEPLLRIPLGMIAGPRVLASRGLWTSLAGHAMIAVGAALTVLLLLLIDPTNAATPLESRFWVQYWTTFTPPGVVVSLVAGAAGAITVMAQRSVLTAGVMIALALIPTISIAGMALASGNLPLAGAGLLRWAVDVAAVVGVGTIVLGLKQALTHRRHAIG